MLKVVETFAGIGAQHKAITKLNKKLKKKFFKVVATVEWDIFCNISYHAIHSQKNHKKSKLSIKSKKTFLQQKQYTWSKDTKTPLTNKQFDLLDQKTINDLYEAVKNHNNFGSIVELTGQKLIKKVKKIDVLTYSFPCQNLSTAGAFYSVNTGMKKGSNSPSSLLWEIGRILLELKKIQKLPKYLILENVKALISKRHKKDYQKWISSLEKLGYKTNTQVLNARKFGIPQNRDRVFAISILNYQGKLKENEPEISYKKYHKKTKNLKKFINNDNPKFKKEYEECVPNNTPSRKRMREQNPFLLKEKYTRTITTKQDRHPNAGTIEYKNTMPNKSQYRFISPREAFMLMGFDSSDYDQVVKAKIKKDIKYKQAGNSVVVNILQAVFQWIYDYENNKL